MKQFNTDKAVVKIHGSVNQDQLKKSTEAFLKKALKQKEGKKNEKNNNLVNFGDSACGGSKTACAG